MTRRRAQGGRLLAGMCLDKRRDAAFVRSLGKGALTHHIAAVNPRKLFFLAVKKDGYAVVVPLRGFAFVDNMRCKPTDQPDTVARAANGYGPGGTHRAGF